ncbi:MAG: hypothetical protein KatS3mg001_416 [Candidatus Pacearchaeota archaeon]|nr:MAG: hypothetical protein KatS3mg001_416 [Candidatus Pacearchaeota archaeon]
MGIVKNLKRILISGLFFSTLSCQDVSSPPPKKPTITQPPPQQPQNRSPTINSNPPTQIDEVSYYEYRVLASDPDGDPLTFSLQQAPTWLSLSNNIISGTSPEVLKDTIFPVKLVVSDGKTNVDQSWNLAVKNLYNYYVLSGEQINQLVSVDSSTLTFSQPTNYSIGDILVSGVSDKTPTGLLREITALSSDKRKITTKNSTLEKLVKEGSFVYEKRLSRGDISNSYMREGIYQQESPNQEFDFNFKLNNVIIHDAFNNPKIPAGKIIMNGFLSLNLGFYFDFESKNRKINKITLKGSLNDKSEIKVNIYSPLSLIHNVEVELIKYKFNPIVFTIPSTPIPVVIIPELTFNAGAYGSLDYQEAKVSQEGEFVAALVYENQNLRKTFNIENDFEFSFTNPTNKNAYYRAYLGPRLNIMFYGVIGPSLRLDPYLQLASEDSLWSFYGGIESWIILKKDVLSEVLPNIAERIFDYRKTLKQGKLEDTVNEEILFVSTRDKNEEIYAIKPDGTGLRRITNNSIPDRYPSWSPDRSKITYISRSNLGNDVFVMNSNGSNIVRLTNDSNDEYLPKWSPDGKSILYIKNVNGKYSLYVMNSDGSNQREIKTALNDDILYASWSPDGGKIVFQGYKDMTWEIFTINSDGSNLKRLTNDKRYANLQPSWSPRGDEIVFASDRDGDFEIYIMNTDGSNVRKITDNSVRDLEPAWSPDAKSIVYTHDFSLESNKNFDLYIINRDGSGNRNLTKHTSRNYHPAWSP